MKRCFKCKRKKNIKLFYKHKGMSDGHLNKCKSCAKKDVRDRAKDPERREEIREYHRKRFQDPEFKKQVALHRAKRKKNYPGKYAARNKFSNALRDGKIKRKPCQVCGDTKSQGHHSDYRRPLHVIWLCFKHHRKLHGQKVK